jgi:DNA-binding response OmpR family regulator
LRLHLSNAGYDVIVAEDAIVAGREVLARAPDLIIVEVDLPYMDGVEFVVALKADATIPEIPVILLSARGDAEHHAQRVRAVAHLSKPVPADRLLRVVALHAGQAS